MTSRHGDLAALELDEGATTREIRTAYRRRAKDCHPDSGGTGQEMIDLTAATERLLGDHAYAGEVQFNRRHDDQQQRPVPLVSYELDDGFLAELHAEMYAEPTGFKRVLINLVVFPLVMVLIVAVLILIAT